MSDTTHREVSPLAPAIGSSSRDMRAEARYYAKLDLSYGDNHEDWRAFQERLDRWAAESFQKVERLKEEKDADEDERMYRLADIERSLITERYDADLGQLRADEFRKLVWQQPDYPWAPGERQYISARNTEAEAERIEAQAIYLSERQAIHCRAYADKHRQVAHAQRNMAMVMALAAAED